MRQVSTAELYKQITLTREMLKPEASIWEGIIEFTNLTEMIFYYMEENMDKKMHEVTKKMEMAEKDIKKKKPKAAVKVLKKAAKKNEKLVKIDKEIRDPIMKKVKKLVSVAKKK